MWLGLMALAKGKPRVKGKKEKEKARVSPVTTVAKQDTLLLIVGAQSKLTKPKEKERAEVIVTYVVNLDT